MLFNANLEALVAAGYDSRLVWACSAYKYSLIRSTSMLTLTLLQYPISVVPFLITAVLPTIGADIYITSLFLAGHPHCDGPLQALPSLIDRFLHGKS